MKSKTNFIKSIQLLLVLMLSLFLLGSSVYAAGGDGSGDGTGGGKDNPLELVSSTPADGSADIAVDTPITLEFSKNVAYLTVRDANMEAVTLWNADSQVPAEISMADDQLEPDLRDFINVTPSESLVEGTTYTIKVDTSLSSKSGDVLLSPLELNFTTVSGEAATTIDTSEEEAPATGEDTASGNSNTTFIIMGILAVVLVAVIIILNKRKKA